MGCYYSPPVKTLSSESVCVCDACRLRQKWCMCQTCRGPRAQPSWGRWGSGSVPPYAAHHPPWSALQPALLVSYPLYICCHHCHSVLADASHGLVSNSAHVEMYICSFLHDHPLEHRVLLCAYWSCSVLFVMYSALHNVAMQQAGVKLRHA